MSVYVPYAVWIRRRSFFNCLCKVIDANKRLCVVEYMSIFEKICIYSFRPGSLSMLSGSPSSNSRNVDISFFLPLFLCTLTHINTSTHTHTHVLSSHWIFCIQLYTCLCTFLYLYRTVGKRKTFCNHCKENGKENGRHSETTWHMRRPVKQKDLISGKRNSIHPSSETPFCTLHLPLHPFPNHQLWQEKEERNVKERKWNVRKIDKNTFRIPAKTF